MLCAGRPLPHEAAAGEAGGGAHRYKERERLAGARLGGAQHVAPRQRVRQGGPLDGRQRSEARVGQPSLRGSRGLGSWGFETKVLGQSSRQHSRALTRGDAGGDSLCGCAALGF